MYLMYRSPLFQPRYRATHQNNINIDSPSVIQSSAAAINNTTSYTRRQTSAATSSTTVSNTANQAIDFHWQSYCGHVRAHNELMITSLTIDWILLVCSCVKKQNKTFIFFQTVWCVEVCVGTKSSGGMCSRASHNKIEKVGLIKNNKRRGLVTDIITESHHSLNTNASVKTLHNAEIHQKFSLFLHFNNKKVLLVAVWIVKKQKGDIILYYTI